MEVIAPYSFSKVSPDSGPAKFLLPESEIYRKILLVESLILGIGIRMYTSKRKISL